MIFCLKGFDEHIVDINLHCFTELFIEHTVHESLVSCAGVFEAEGHYPVAIGPAISNERSLLAIVGIHQNLIVTREGIHERQKFIAHCCFYQSIDVWQRENILWTGLVQIGKVHADSPLPVFLFDNYRVSEPVWISYFCY